MIRLILNLFLYAIAYFIFSCNPSEPSSADDKYNSPETDRKLDISTMPPGEVVHATSGKKWVVDVENKTIQLNPDFDSSVADPARMIAALNEEYPQIKLAAYKMKQDTLFTRITDAVYLTEQMGSTGAADYLADVIINLTSITGVRYVLISFREGSHASPGIWSREDFKDFRMLTSKN
jgi:hypothetical protein